MIIVKFLSLVTLLPKRDNWREVFSKVYLDREIITSKLRELEPVRNKIAHMRDLSESEISKLKRYSLEIRNCLNR